MTAARFGFRTPADKWQHRLSYWTPTGTERPEELTSMRIVTQRDKRFGTYVIHHTFGIEVIVR
jgi:hypothetical protein